VKLALLFAESRNKMESLLAMVRQMAVLLEVFPDWPMRAPNETDAQYRNRVFDWFKVQVVRWHDKRSALLTEWRRDDA